MPWLECVHTIRATRHAVRLRKPLTTLGRASANDVVLDDPTIDANHATVVRAGSTFTIAASDRSQQVYVNGRRVRSSRLSPGDELLVGPWKLTFHEGEPVEPTEDDDAALGMMEQLVQLSADMMRDTTPERLFATLLKGLVTLTRAEKGFIILLKDGERHLAASHNVGEDQLDLSRISDSIVDRVVQDQIPLIISDALHDTRFGKAKSVVDLKLSSVMCVPLIHADTLLGVIYLGNDAITGLFTERDLTVLRIYASQASLVVYHALLLNQLRLDNRVLRDKLQKGADGELIGSSEPMRKVYKVIQRIAPTDVSVLVLGETGTGKELVARSLHARSPRAKGPFIAINCGAIPEALLESELFGHRKGAFTGADADKVGRIESADGGTLFLDEVGEMPMNLQVKLLRVLQERVIQRVGDISGRAVDIRVISATNRDPVTMIDAGTFRSDLYYRLNEITLELPPLRDRGEDIVVLASWFLRTFREKYSGKCSGFTNQALAAMKSHGWPGNVRELENRVKKAVIMADRPLLNPEDLGLDAVEARRHILPLSDAQEQFKLDYIQRVLDMNHGNKAQTARDLGVDARTIFRYLEKLPNEA